MEWKFHDFSPVEQQNIMTTLINDFHTDNIVNISSFLSGVEEINLNWMENDELRAAVLEGVGADNIDNNPASMRAFANIIYYLGKAGIKWKALPEHVTRNFEKGIKVCAASFKEQGIGNLIYG
jgi:hypothetical protein